METFNINEPILFGPGKLTASQRFWKWLAQLSANLSWQPLPLGANVANYGGGWQAAQYAKDAKGMVYVRGLVTGTGLVTAGLVGILPPGFRPVSLQMMTVMGYTGSAIVAVRIDVQPGGLIYTNGSTGGNPTGWTSLWFNFCTY